ncbi:hypothetical protein KY290_037153 [Solanum tuberosum]|uniref:Uncharacterized protein n=1 Tax=Solanum tuberosum TaxID=4113 RepID=A0ABQ7TVE1_SOLTU|nr:hypothetical protein KY289_036675 [Solanum tuberosum]KAH0639884.1 hypothetical protein KY285_036470 [Solanum tuberosum]KAH0738448.1 hypothetical protein KY290_037153 [Solanum tuberosum]
MYLSERISLPFKGLQGAEVVIFLILHQQCVPMIRVVASLDPAAETVPLGEEAPEPAHITQQYQEPMHATDLVPTAIFGPQQEGRRTNRVVKPIILLKDYVTTKNPSAVSIYSMVDVQTYDTMSPVYQSFVLAFSTM